MQFNDYEGNVGDCQLLRPMLIRCLFSINLTIQCLHSVVFIEAKAVPSLPNLVHYDVVKNIYFPWKNFCIDVFMKFKIK